MTSECTGTHLEHLEQHSNSTGQDRTSYSHLAQASQVTQIHGTFSLAGHPLQTALVHQK